MQFLLGGLELNRDGLPALTFLFEVRFGDLSGQRPLVLILFEGADALIGFVERGALIRPGPARRGNLVLRIAERRSRFSLSGLRGRQFRFERGAGRLESRALGGAFFVRDVADVLNGAIEEGARPVDGRFERLDALVDGRPQRVEILSERFPEVVGGGDHGGFDLIGQPIVGHK